jgi:ATP-binding cassette subfamily B protein
MLKLLKYLKPFTLLLILAIALLYGQAMADLALPDYMSKIVNIGIQQGGNEDVLPQVLRRTDMEQIQLFLDDQSKMMLKDVYSEVEVGTSAYSELEELFPNTDNERLFQLKSSDEEAMKALELPVSKALLAISSVKQLMENPVNGQIIFNDQLIPEGSDIFKMIESLPEPSRMEFLASANEKFASMGEDTIIQAGAALTLSLYDDMGFDVDGIRSKYILMTGLIMLGITLLGAIASILVGFLASRIAAGLGRDLRSKIFTKVSHFSNAEFDKFSTASLITRSTNDVMQVQTLMVIMIRMVFYAPILAIGGIIRALDNNSSMSWIIALAVGVLILMIGIVFSIAMPKFKVVQKLVDKVNLVMRENLTGMMVIRAFNTQNFEEKRFDQANKELTDTNLFVNRVMVFLMPVMMFIMNSVMILIVWVGAKEISNANMQVGDMMAFMQYAMQIIMAFLMMSMMFIMIPRASVAEAELLRFLILKGKLRIKSILIILMIRLKVLLNLKMLVFNIQGRKKPC